MKVGAILTIVALAACDNGPSGQADADGDGPARDADGDVDQGADGDADADGDVDGDADGDADQALDSDVDEQPQCLGTGVSDTETNWTLPAKGREGYRLQWDLPAGDDLYVCDDLVLETTARWVLMDLTGDGQPDLVVYEDGCYPDHAQSFWLVYVGQEGGFAQEPIQWSLPAKGREGYRLEWSSLSGEDLYVCEDMVRETTARWMLLELTGDGQPDLVVHEDGCHPEHTQSQWFVYVGQQGGFAQEPIEWSLPVKGREGYRLEWSQPSGEDLYVCEDLVLETTARWVLMDLTGDGQPDLVVHEDGCHPDHTQSQWYVHAGQQGGFAQEPTLWSLPVKGREGYRLEWSQLSGEDLYVCEDLVLETTAQWMVTDISGDSQPDLVVYEDGCHPDHTQSQWFVHLGQQGGFAQDPVEWSLPVKGREGYRLQWSGPSGEDLYVCEDLVLETTARWMLADMTSDGQPDLLIFEDGCYPDHIQSHWLVHPGVDRGFAQEPFQWLLPPRGRQAAPIEWAQPSGDDLYACEDSATDGTARWMLMDLTADGHSDLVIYDDDCNVGHTEHHWFVYEGQCQAP